MLSKLKAVLSSALCLRPNVYKVKMSMEKVIREDQVEILEYNFTRISKNPDRATLDLIAAEAGLSVEEVLVWFKKRLGEWRKSEGLPSESRSVRD